MLHIGQGNSESLLFTKPQKYHINVVANLAKVKTEIVLRVFDGVG